MKTNKSPSLLGIQIFAVIIIISIFILIYWMIRYVNDIKHETQAIHTATTELDHGIDSPSGSRYGVPKYDRNTDPMPLDMDRLDPNKRANAFQDSTKRPVKVYEKSYDSKMLLQ